MAERECIKIINNIITNIEIEISKQNLSKLIENRDNILRELEEIESSIEEENRNIITLCNFSEDGHQIILERDDGPYGKLWRICTRCGYEY